MTAKLYWFPVSHPSQAVKREMELKGIPYELAGVLPGNQGIHLRLAGFRGGTVPAVKLDGRRVQGSLAIARELEAIQPEPPLFPSDPGERARIEELERWGDDELQNVPRRILRWGLTQDVGLRRWMAEDAGVPAPGAVARVSGLNARFYARAASTDEATARRLVGELPATLDRIDALLADGTISAATPNAAAFQILCTVRALGGFSDFEPIIAGRPCDLAARELFPEDFTKTPVPPFVPRDWLPPG